MSNIFSIRQKDSVVVIVQGKPFTVANDHPQYELLIQALDNDNMDAVEGIVAASDRMTKLIGVFGDVQVFAGHVTFQGRPMHNYLVERIVKMMHGGRDPAPYASFLDRVMRNPSHRAVQELSEWLETADMPITPDGMIVAYKVVRASFLDKHSGTYDNTPGKVVQMERNAVDDDSSRECSAGLHFCSAGYIPSFYNGRSGDKIVVVLLDPTDVVSFPKDHGKTKGRCCRYTVMFEISHEEATGNKFMQDKDKLVFDIDAYMNPKPAYEKVEGAKALVDAGCFIEFDKNDEVWDVFNKEGLFILGYDASETRAWELAVAKQAVSVTDTTFEARLAAAEMALHISPLQGKTIPDRMTAVEDELGLTDRAPPQIDRLARIEAQL